MKQYEYWVCVKPVKCDSIEELQEFLNTIGKAGWQIVNVYFNNDKVYQTPVTCNHFYGLPSIITYHFMREIEPNEKEKEQITV
jgi:hypothetical protein